MKSLSIIALGTWRQFVRDRIFYLAFFVAALLVAFSYLLAMLTIIESRKILLDFGFAALSATGVCIATYLGVWAVAREIENRTIYTIISKPISRTTYLLGKFLGAAVVLMAAQALLSLSLIFVLWAAGESAPPGFLTCCIFIFLENLVVLSFASLVSIPFASLMAMGLSAAFFLIGRSSVSIEMMSNKAEAPAARAFARGLYYIFPNLERFNLRDVVAYGQPFPGEMIPVTFAYTLAYCTACLAFALFIFRKRDLP